MSNSYGVSVHCFCYVWFLWAKNKLKWIVAILLLVKHLDGVLYLVLDDLDLVTIVTSGYIQSSILLILCVFDRLDVCILKI